jgi:hypothetical protein
LWQSDAPQINCSAAVCVLRLALIEIVVVDARRLRDLMPTIGRPPDDRFPRCR